MRDPVYHKSLYWKLFSLWLLSIPFTRVNIIGTLSIDNILAPILFGLWVISASAGGMGSRHVYQRAVHPGWIFAMILLYTALRAAAAMLSWGAGQVVVSELWVQAKAFLYLILPLLYIRSHYDFQRVALFLVPVTVIVSLSSFAHSIGLINLDFARNISEGRLDVVNIGRSGGLVGNYGDIAVLTAFTAIAMQCLGQQEGGRFGRLLGWKGFVYLCLLLGIIGSQSRNVILTLLVAISVYLFMSGLSKRRAKLLLVTGITILGMVSLALFAFYATTIFDMILGSGSVRGSVESRFVQYRESLRLIAEYPLLGPTGLARVQNLELLSHVHNIWLGTALRGGVFAALSMFGLFLILLLGGMRQFSRGDYGCWAILTLAGASAALTASSFYSAQNSYVYLMLFGALLGSVCVGFRKPSRVHDESFVDPARQLSRKRLSGALDGPLKNRY